MVFIVGLLVVLVVHFSKRGHLEVCPESGNRLDGHQSDE
jgi:hypothetical protein